MKVDKVPDGLAWTDKRTVETLDLLDLLDASFFVEVKLIGNGVAMDAQLASRSASAFSLPSLQKKEHVETALDLSVFLFAGEPLKLID